jgi:hypothetical protein
MKKSLILLILSTIVSINGYAQKKDPPYKPINKNEQKKAPSTAPVQRTTVAPASNNVAQTQQPQPKRTKRGRSRSISYTSGRSGFHQGDKLLNIGVGLSSYYYGTPIGASFESGISDDISVGAQFDYNSGNYDGYYSSSYRWGYSAYYVGLRGSYHLNNILQLNEDKIDLYAGVGLGYQRFRWDDESYGSGYGYSYNYRSGLFFNYFVGGKYYFTPKVGAFVELGYTGLSSSRVGISFKF